MMSKTNDVTVVNYASRFMSEQALREAEAKGYEIKALAYAKLVDKDIKVRLTDNLVGPRNEFNYIYDTDNKRHVKIVPIELIFSDSDDSVVSETFMSFENFVKVGKYQERFIKLKGKTGSTTVQVTFDKKAQEARDAVQRRLNKEKRQQKKAMALDKEYAKVMMTSIEEVRKTLVKNNGRMHYSFKTGFEIKHLKPELTQVNEFDIKGKLTRCKTGDEFFTFDEKFNTLKVSISQHVKLYYRNHPKYYAGFLYKKNLISGTPIWKENKEIVGVISWSWIAQDGNQYYMVGKGGSTSKTCNIIELHSTKMKGKKLEQVKIKAQIATTETAAKIESLTKEMRNLKVIASNAAKLTPVAITETKPVVRKRKSKKNKKGLVQTVLQTITIVSLILPLIMGNPVGLEKINPNYSSAFLKKHCDKVLDEPTITKIMASKEISEAVITLSDLTETKFKSLIKEDYQKCLRGIGEIKMCIEQIRFDTSAKYAELLIDIKKKFIECQQMHDCITKCEQNPEIVALCQFDSLAKCKSTVEKQKNHAIQRVWKQIDTEDRSHHSGSYGCKSYKHWKSLGWLRGNIGDKCTDSASFDCEKDYDSCIDYPIINRHRICENVKIDATQTDWDRGNKCVIGSMNHEQGLGSFSSQRTTKSVQNPTQLCTLACFPFDILYLHMTNQPACSSCLVPFEILWEKDCFKEIATGIPLIGMQIYKKHTVFEFEEKKMFTCENNYNFKKCCNGKGPSEIGTERTLVEKYCHCGVSQNSFIATTIRFLGIMSESVLTPQFLFHFFIFWIMVFWSKNLATFYIILAIFWIIPTSQALCGVENLIPSDLGTDMGIKTLQQINVKVGQCFQSGGSTYELKKISVQIPYAFKKHIPYNIKVTCSKLDWGCKYGKHEQVFNEISECYTKCINGVRTTTQEIVSSFHADGCTMWFNVATRNDVCFSGGEGDTYVTLFEILSAQPTITLELISHATKKQKNVIVSSEEKTNSYLRIHNFKINNVVAPKMIATRLGLDYCAYTYVETSNICHSQDFAYPMQWDPDCLNLKQKWNHVKQQFQMNWDKNDYASKLFERFNNCPINYKKKASNDTLLIIQSLDWVELVVSGEHFQYAPATAKCDENLITVNSKPGISGYHSTTLIEYTNTGKTKCKFEAKLVGCVSTEGTFMILDAGEKTPVSYWCSYNATNQVSVLGNGIKIHEVFVVKNYVPHKTQYHNLIYFAVNKMNTQNIREFLSGFWQKLNWPEWSINIFSWIENDFNKVMCGTILIGLMFISFSRGNIMMTAVLLTLFYLTSLTDIVFGLELEQGVKIMQYDGGHLSAHIVLRIISELKYLLYVCMEIEGNLLTTILETCILCSMIMASIIITKPIALFFWSFKFTTRFTNRILSNSEVYNGNIWYHYPFTNILLRNITKKINIEDDLEDEFAVIMREPGLNATKHAKTIMWCTDDQITMEQAKFTLTNEGITFKKVLDKAWVMGYKKAELKLWIVPKHSIVGNKGKSGIFCYGGKIEDFEGLGSQDILKFRATQGYSGYVIANPNAMWMFLGRIGENNGELWHKIRNLTVEESEQILEKQNLTKREFIRVKIIENEVIINDSYEAEWKVKPNEDEALNRFYQIESSNTNVLASTTNLFCLDHQTGQQSTEIFPNGNFKYDGTHYGLSKYRSRVKVILGQPTVLIDEKRTALYMGASHLKGYKIPNDYELKTDYWSFTSSQIKQGYVCKYIVVDFKNNKTDWFLKKPSSVIENFFIQDAAIFIQAYVLPGNFPSGSLIMHDDRLIGVSSFVIKRDEKDYTAFVGPFSTRYVNEHGNGKFYATKSGENTIIECYSNAGTFNKFKIIGKYTAIESRAFNSNGWDNFSELQTKAIQTAGYVSANIGDGTAFNDSQILEERNKMYRMKSKGEDLCAPMIFYTDFEFGPTMSSEEELDIGQHDLISEEIEFIDQTTDIKNKIYANLNAGKNWVVITSHVEDLCNALEKNKLPIDLLVKVNFYMDKQYEFRNVLEMNKKHFVYDKRGIRTHPKSILNKLNKQDVVNEWDISGSAVWHKVKIGKSGKEVNFNEFLEKFDDTSIQGLVCNATSIGSYFIKEKKLYSQYHVTYGNNINIEMVHHGNCETGKAAFANKNADIVVYGGSAAFTQMVVGKIYVAFNVHYVVGLYLRCVDETSCAQRNNQAFVRLEPVTYSNGEWTRRQFYGYPGMSGSPIIDLKGNLVGLFGLQKFTLSGEETLLTYVPNLSENQEIKDLFGSGAQFIKDTTLKHPKKFFNLSVPTGIGKSTSFVIELLKKNQNNILVLQPNRSACIGAYERIVSLLNKDKTFNCKYYISLMMGTTECNENKIHGDSSAPMSITFQTYGYAIQNYQCLEHYQIIMLDECHKLDDTDVVAMTVFTEVKCLNSKILRATATSTELDERASDILQGQTVSSTQYHIHNHDLITGNVESLNKDDSVYWFYDGRNFSNNLNSIVGVKKEHVKNKKTLVFCATKKECDRGVQMAIKWGLKATVAYSGAVIDYNKIEPGTWIFATNIAQQSITIPGLECVVDLGVEKKPIIRLELNEDGLFYTKKLETRNSDAAARIQRRGRVGRTSIGIYYGTIDANSPSNSFNESLIPEIILKCYHLGLTESETCSMLNSKYKDTIKKYIWVRPDKISSNESYKNYTNLYGVKYLNYDRKLNLAMQALGDPLYLYLRAHMVDEKNLTPDDILKLVSHVGESSKTKHRTMVIPTHLANRCPANNSWYREYCLAVQMVTIEKFLLETNYIFQSYQELQFDEDSIDYENFKMYVNPQTVLDQFEENAEDEYQEDSASALLLGGATAIAVTLLAGGLASLAINKKGDRYIMSAYSITNENLAVAAKHCVERYYREEDKINSNVSCFEKLKKFIRKIFSKVKNLLKKYVSPNFKEDSLELIWQTVLQKIVLGTTAVGSLVGLTAVPTLVTICGGSVIGLLIDRCEKVLGGAGTFVLLTTIEAVVFHVVGLGGGIMLGITALVTTFIKDMIITPKDVLGVPKPSTSKYLSLIVSTTACVGMFKALSTGALVSMAVPSGLAVMAPHITGYGNLAGSFLFFKHIYIGFTSHDNGRNWIDFIVSMAGGAVAAALSMNPYGFAVGTSAVVVLTILRFVIKSHYEEKACNSKQNIINVEAKMKEYDAIVNLVLNIVSLAIDPWSVISIIIEWVYSKLILDLDHTEAFQAASSRSGIPILVELIDVMIKMCFKYLGETEVQDAQPKSFIEIVYHYLKDVFYNIKTFITNKTYVKNSVCTSIKKFLSYLWNLFKRVGNHLGNMVSNVFNDAVKTSVDTSISRIQENIPITKHFIRLNKLDEDSKNLNRNQKTDQNLVQSWFINERKVKRLAVRLAQLKVATVKRNVEGKFALMREIKLPLKNGRVWKLPTSLEPFQIRTADLHEIAQYHNFRSIYGNGACTIYLYGIQVKVETTYDSNWAKLMIKTMGTETIIYVQEHEDGVKAFVVSTADDAVFTSICKGITALFEIEDSSVVGNFEDALKEVSKHGITKITSTLMDTLKSTTNMLYDSMKKYLLERNQKPLEDKIIPPNEYDYYIYNKTLLEINAINCSNYCITEYQCPSLYYRKIYEDRLLPLNKQQTREIVDKMQLMEFERYVKITDGNIEFYLDNQIGDFIQNLKAVCTNGGYSLIIIMEDGADLWSEFGNKDLTLILQSNELFYINGTDILIEKDIKPPKGKLYDSIKHITESQLADYKLEVGYSTYDKSDTSVMNSLVEEGQMMQQTGYTVNSLGGFSNCIINLLRKLNCSNDRELEIIASNKIVKRYNEITTKNLNLEVFHDAIDYVDFSTCQHHTNLPLWTAGFDQPTKGKINTTWFPHDKTRLTPNKYNFTDVMRQYVRLNQSGRDISAKDWEEIRKRDRYELPRRVLKDNDKYHNQISRGLWKFQQLQEAGDFFDNCNNILSPTCGYGGFEQGFSIIYKKNKPKNIYSSTLIEEKHRMPDWNEMTVDQSNVSVIKLIDEETPGHGNIKDKRFNNILTNVVKSGDIDLLIFDIGEFKNTDQAQFNYWAKRERDYSLIEAIVKLIKETKKGSKLCMKFTGVFANCNQILYQVLKNYSGVKVHKLGTTSLFSTEFYILCKGKTNNGLTMADTSVFCNQLAMMISDNLASAQYIMNKKHNHRPLIRTDWITSPGSGRAYTDVVDLKYPSGFVVKLKDTPFGNLNESFLPKFDPRIKKVKSYLANYCGITKHFNDQKRLGFKNVQELGYYPMKKNEVSLKFTRNGFISNFLEESFGLTDEVSTYGQTQATKKFKDESIEKRLDVNPGDLDDKVFLELMEILSLMKTEYGESLVSKCRLLTPDRVHEMLNKGGATSMFSKYPNMRKFIEENAQISINGTPIWYDEAVTRCLLKWKNNENSHCFFSIMHKNEPKMKKNAEDGYIDPGTVGNLEEYNYLQHRFIQYNDEITRIAHYILFGELMSLANKQKVYKGTINGTPPHLVGRILRTMWDIHEKENKHTDYGINKNIDVTLTKRKEKYLEGKSAAALLDYSKWDTTVTKQERYLEYLFIRQFYPESLWDMIKTCCEELAYGICVDREGHMFIRDGQRGSGEVFFTSFGNTLLVSANTFRCTAKAAGLTYKQVTETIAKATVKISETVSKTFEITTIPQVADGDDVVIFGTKNFLSYLEKQIDEKLREANKMCRSGNKSGISIVTDFKDVQFCSYKYEPILIGPNANEIRLSIKDKNILARTNPDYKIYYLPTRPLTDILSRLRLTLKQQAVVWNKEDLTENGCVRLTRSKIISYLLMFPHIRILRYLTILMLSNIGDGTMTQYDIKQNWGILNNQMTTMGAFQSLYKVDTLDNIAYREHSDDSLDLKKLRKNLSLIRRKISLRLLDNVNNMIRTSIDKKIEHPKVLNWDNKLAKYVQKHIQNNM